MKASLSNNKYLVFLLATINFILSPITISLAGVNPAIIIGVNYSILIFSGLLLAIRKIPKILAVIFGLSTLLLVWLEYFMKTDMLISELRLYSAFLFFSVLTYILIRNILIAQFINIKVIIGTIAGYILLGILGGIAFEFLELKTPGALSLKDNLSGYVFYYFSFISLSTIGYGDVTPLSSQAQALTVLISIIGQFYMAIGVALFIGKFLSTPKSYID